MVFSRVFVLLSITMCLVACLCAHAAGTRAEAQKAVTNIQKLTTQTLEKAQQRYTDAERVRRTVESRKEKAEKAASEAAATANGNEEAKEFVEKAKSEMQNCLKLHPDAQTKAQNAVPVIQNLMKKARALDNRAEATSVPSPGSAEELAQVCQSVKALQKERDDIEKQIGEADPQLEAASSALLQLSNHADKAEMAKDQVKAVVAVAQMSTLLSAADADIASIQEKKEKVDAIVEELGETAKKAPEDLMLQSVRISDKAESDQGEITRIFKKVQEDKDAMLEHKKTADGFLATIKTATDESQVRNYLRGITEYAGKAEESLKKINKAVTSADIYVRSANNRKQEMQDLLSPQSSKPTDKDSTEPSDKQPEETAEGATTKPTRKDTNKQRKINPGQPLNDATTKPMTLGTSGQSIAKPSQPVQGAETKPSTEDTKEQNNTNQGQPETDGTKQTSEETAGQSDAKPSQPLQGAGTKLTSEDTTGKNDTNTSEHLQDVTTKPTSEDTTEEKETRTGQYATKRANSTGTKGIVSPYDTINDGAITASFSLLLALIACAALN